MVFSSTIFLMVFLPLFLLSYYATPQRFRSYIILVASYAFYAWWRVDFVMLFMAVTAFNFFMSKALLKYETYGKKIMLLGVAGNLLTLGYFKYFNFGVDTLNSLLGYGEDAGITAWSVILPIGISFYIFQAISYLIDVYRGDAKPADRFIDFAAFIALFPQLIAGPVIRYKDIADQFSNRTHTWDKFNEGAIRFSMGFCKKVLIADTLAPIADAAFALEDPTLAQSWLGILAYAAQLYFDFSGYSDMAIGLGLMVGFRFIENFNHPYTSRSITEFWRRWHISLSTWLRDYLYIPLGGNRKGARRTYINLVLTMVLGGLWHGANWTFVLWGALHGGVMAYERLMNNAGRSAYMSFLALPITLFVVLIGWVLFRAENVSTAFGLYAGMAGLNGIGFTGDVLWSVTNFQIFTLLSAYVIVFTSPYWVKNNLMAQDVSWAAHISMKRQVCVAVLFTLAVCKLISQSFSPFLYFQF